MENNEMEVTKEAPRPQDHWLVVGAIKAARALIKAADDLSFAAQIAGGTAGRDAALCAAIAQWTAERDKQKQMLRIIELEGDDPEIGAGFELCASPLTTALAAKEAENAELRAKVERLRAFVADVAGQWLPNEPDPFDDFDPCLEDGYCVIVERARTTLAETQP